jgi:hypothetical protein
VTGAEMGIINNITDLNVALWQNIRSIIFQSYDDILEGNLTGCHDIIDL